MRVSICRSPVLLPTAVIGLGVDLRFQAGLRRGLPVRHLPLNLPEHRYHRFHLVLSDRHLQLLPS